MEHYRQNNRSRLRHKLEEHRTLSLFDYGVLIVTIVAAVLLVMSYMAHHIDPNILWVFAILGLIAPIIYIVNIITMLYWIVRWRFYMLIPLVLLLLGIGNISLFFRPTLSKYYDDAPTRSAFVIMSYNVMGFITSESGKPCSSMDSILSFILEQKPDILCMQEFQTTHSILKRDIDYRLSGLNYNKVFYRIKGTANDTGWGLAVYSRFPIIRSGGINFENSSNSAMWVDVVVPAGDTVRLFNNHLQTTAINSSDRDFITTQEFVSSDSDIKKERIRNILFKLRNNYRVRAVQADSIAPQIRDCRYPVIVCGDFNDTPMSYVYNTIRGDLSDAFVEKGRGITNTYRGFFNLFRIDYVLHSRSIRTMSYLSPASHWSDHKPVVVNMKIKK